MNSAVVWPETEHATFSNRYGMDQESGCRVTTSGLFFTSLPVSHHKSSLSCGALSSAHIIGAAPETAPDDSSSPIEVQLRPASPEDFPPLNEIER